MLHNLFNKNRHITIILLSAVAVICPVLYLYVDLPVAKYIHAHQPEMVRQLAQSFTGAGNWFLYFLATVALIGWFVFKNKTVFIQSLFPLLAAAAAGIITTILKALVGRWRPKAYFQLDGVYGFDPFHSAHASWPSGHSSSIMATMAAVAILFPKWRVPCFAVAVLIGSTRMALAAHYLSDVFAGLILGYLCAHWLYYLFVRRKLLPERPSDL